MKLDQLFADAQPQPAADGFARVRAHDLAELDKQPGHILLRDAWPGVVHTDHQPLVADLGADGDAARFGKAQCIDDQV